MPALLDDPQGIFCVLVNDEGQHSLWPEPIAVPDGWHVAYPADSRENCLAFVTSNWTDMRPSSLRREQLDA